ncbi:hypothetical protein ACF1E9_22200 [Streptomyces roseolus]|uniref:hypothetical protein n=1 Tax=Streptomyces roseolus TaxID=67358 RepID=UPI0036FEA948
MLLMGGATVAFFLGGLGTPGFMLAIALASSLFGVWTASLETAAGREPQAAAERDGERI